MVFPPGRLACCYQQNDHLQAPSHQYSIRTVWSPGCHLLSDRYRTALLDDKQRGSWLVWRCISSFRYTSLYPNSYSPSYHVPGLFETFCKLPVDSEDGSRKMHESLTDLFPANSCSHDCCCAKHYRVSLSSSRFCQFGSCSSSSGTRSGLSLHQYPFWHHHSKHKR